MKVSRVLPEEPLKKGHIEKQVPKTLNKVQFEATSRSDQTGQPVTQGLRAVMLIVLRQKAWLMPAAEAIAVITNTKDWPGSAISLAYKKVHKIIRKYR